MDSPPVSHRSTGIPALDWGVTMSRLTFFFLETLGRIGSSIFAGTLVSCLILGRMEWLHIILMGSGLLLMGWSFPIAPGRYKTNQLSNPLPKQQDDKT